ncbi:MAG: hypothetical protein K0S56_3963 [Microvirga sp.]|nr:hypothetical protein [Microvirga sp.]
MVQRTKRSLSGGDAERMQNVLRTFHNEVRVGQRGSVDAGAARRPLLMPFAFRVQATRSAAPAALSRTADSPASRQPCSISGWGAPLPP